jgi:hypothetical protein
MPTVCKDRSLRVAIAHMSFTTNASADLSFHVHVPCDTFAEGQPAERRQGHVVVSAYCDDQRPAKPDIRHSDVRHASRFVGLRQSSC